MKNFYKTALKNILIFSMLASPLMLMAGEAEREAANGLLDITRFEMQMDSAINASIEMVKQMNPAMGEHEADIRAFYEKHMSAQSLRKDVVSIYSETFTVEELKYMTAFYMTETGQKALEKIPELMKRSMQMAQTRVMENMGELEEVLKQKQAAK